MRLLGDFPFPISATNAHSDEISPCQNTPHTDDQGITQARHLPQYVKSVWGQVSQILYRRIFVLADELSTGHFIFECKSTRPYVSRPSRTQQLAKVNPLDKLKLEGKPSVELPDEFRTKYGFKTFDDQWLSRSDFPRCYQNRDGQQATRSQGERAREGQTRRTIRKHEVEKEGEEVSFPCLPTWYKLPEIHNPRPFLPQRIFVQFTIRLQL